MRCLNCKYDLRQLTEHRCPECGREFDPKDASTFDDELPRKSVWIRLSASVATIYVVTLFLILFVGLPLGAVSFAEAAHAALVLTPIIAIVYFVIVTITGEFA